MYQTGSHAIKSKTFDEVFDYVAGDNADLGRCVYGVP